MRIEVGFVDGGFNFKCYNAIGAGADGGNFGNNASDCGCAVGGGGDFFGGAEFHLVDVVFGNRTHKIHRRKIGDACNNAALAVCAASHHRAAFFYRKVDDCAAVGGAYYVRNLVFRLLTFNHFEFGNDGFVILFHHLVIGLLLFKFFFVYKPLIIKFLSAFKLNTFGIETAAANFNIIFELAQFDGVFYKFDACKGETEFNLVAKIDHKFLQSA